MHHDGHELGKASQIHFRNREVLQYQHGAGQPVNAHSAYRLYLAHGCKVESNIASCTNGSIVVKIAVFHQNPRYA